MLPASHMLLGQRGALQNAWETSCPCLCFHTHPQPWSLRAQGYRGIVLVSPAIFAAKVPGQPPARHNQALDPRLEAVERVVEAEDAPSPPNSKPWAQRLRLCARALQFAAARVILRLARPFIVLTLRSRIRKKKWVGVAGVLG